MSEQGNDIAEPDTNGSDDSSGESFEGSDDPTMISDDQLPEDLRPTDDNPLAKPEGEDGSGGGVNLQEQAGEAAGGPPA